MTLRSEPKSDCGICRGVGIISVSKDPDLEADCVCTDPAEPTAVEPPRPMCPECRAGKHAICIHQALSDGDEFVDCACGCEPSRTCPTCRDVVPIGWTLDDHLNCNWPEDHDV